eukprot:1241114-Amphidinium_carterae.1
MCLRSCGPYVVFATPEMGQHGLEMAVAEQDILKRPTLYHVGSNFLTSGEEPSPPRVTIEKNAEVSSDL